MAARIVGGLVVAKLVSATGAASRMPAAGRGTGTTQLSVSRLYISKEI